MLDIKHNIQDHFIFINVLTLNIIQQLTDNNVNGDYFPNSSCFSCILVIITFLAGMGCDRVSAAFGGSNGNTISGHYFCYLTLYCQAQFNQVQYQSN